MQQQGNQWTQEGHGGYKRDYSVSTHLSEYPLDPRSFKPIYLPIIKHASSMRQLPLQRRICPTSVSIRIGHFDPATVIQGYRNPSQSHSVLRSERDYHRFLSVTVQDGMSHGGYVGCRITERQPLTAAAAYASFLDDLSRVYWLRIASRNVPEGPGRSLPEGAQWSA